MRKLRGNTDYPIGEELIHNNSIIKVVEDKTDSECLNCVLFRYKDCDEFYCTARRRNDNKNIYFKKI